jgi:hypothetical protein
MSHLPTTATGVLSLMANTSTECDVFSDQIIQSVKDGEESAIKVLVQMTAMSRVIDRVKKEIKNNYLNESEKYPGNSFEFMGNSIQKGDVKTEYDFTVCGHPEWTHLENVITDSKEAQKEIETFLKALKQPTSFLDKGTGEWIDIIPPLKKSTPGLKVSIK